MGFQAALTPTQELELLEYYQDNYSINDLSVIYRVSIRTIYRVLAKYNVPRKKPKGYIERRPYRLKKKIRPDLQPCGTNAAYQRHRKKGEYPCTPCLDAHAADVKEAKEKK